MLLPVCFLGKSEPALGDAPAPKAVLPLNYFSERAGANLLLPGAMIQDTCDLSHKRICHGKFVLGSFRAAI